MPDSTPSGMVDTALEALRVSVALEGVAVVDVADLGVEGELLYQAGLGAIEVRPTVHGMLRRGLRGPAHQIGPDRRPILVFPWTLPPGRPGGLALWRMPGARPWEARDHALAAAAGALLLVTLTHGPAEAGIDRLTGLPNRHYFLDEVDRRIERLDKDEQPGTLVLIEMDALERLSEAYGQVAGDWLRSRTATLLRAMVRPADLVARTGSDQFALWLDGMDHLTAAERAESLRERRLTLPDTLSHGVLVTQTLSIGIASRLPGRGEDIQTVMRRARMAAYEVRQAGGAGWRVSHPPA
ncbi:MAG: GGDEF domain-containing protein [Acetobacteraceae bacterium]|nr:GGDEF domain-containing protein [Acetobacteraceae bacterium]